MKKQAGFTLVELVVVIAVLGILAATALPRFINVQSNARVAAMKGLAASMRSAASLARAQWMASGADASNLTAKMDNATVNLNASGYPATSATGIGSAMQTLDDASYKTTDYATFYSAGFTDCKIVYDPVKRHCRCIRCHCWKLWWLEFESMNAQGFTLVELVVVIAVASVLVAVAAPRFASGDIFETRGDAGLLSSTLRYAQKTAIAQRREVFVLHTDDVPDVVKLCFDVACNQPVINPETADAYVFTSSKNVDIDSLNAELGFDALGRAVPDTATSYSVTNRKNTSQSIITISVEANTGYIH